ncbi:MAG: butyrate kinase [Treponema sp.]|jgi:butyrate kinase|nr:butyrate kinase [Treponema sp.]
MKKLRVFAINPGSTSTKIALFEDEKVIFSKNIAHDETELKAFKTVPDQLGYRRDIIIAELVKAGYTLTKIDVFSARGGGLASCEGGVYEINESLLHHARIGFTIMHPATLGSQLAHEFAQRFGGKAFVVNPPDVDEFSVLSRITGFSDIFRESRIHALNHKEVGIRYASSLGKDYYDMNLIIAHIGGGLSVAAHQKGKMIDSNDNVQGDGPMAPTRAGALPAASLIKLCFSGKYTEKELLDRVMKRGGWMDHLDTADGRAVNAMIAGGNNHAKLIMDATIYQISKVIGACGVVLEGKAEAIILTGGLAHDAYLVSEIKRKTGFLAPVTVIAGEFEMEALAAGAIRVLRGIEDVKVYTGEPVWNGL